MKHLIAVLVVSLFAIAAQAGDACCQTKAAAKSKATVAKADGSTKGAQLLVKK